MMIAALLCLEASTTASWTWIGKVLRNHKMCFSHVETSSWRCNKQPLHFLQFAKHLAQPPHHYSQLFLNNHYMNPLHSLIKSKLFYSVQVLVMKISTGFSTLLESFLNCSATMRCSFPRYSESMGWNVRCMQLNLALTVHIQVVYFCFSLPQHELQWALARRRLNLAGPQQLSMTMTELGPVMN